MLFAFFFCSNTLCCVKGEEEIVEEGSERDSSSDGDLPIDTRYSNKKTELLALKGKFRDLVVNIGNFKTE
jgi:hypothetical protein